VLWQKGDLMPNEQSVEVRFFADHRILPEQFFPECDRWKGEHSLLYAVVEDAWKLCQAFKNPLFLFLSRRTKRLAYESYQWFCHPDYVAPFNLRYICDHLGVDTDFILEGVQKFYERAKKNWVSEISEEEKVSLYKKKPVQILPRYVIRRNGIIT
jgi:hypothetical protein